MSMTVYLDKDVDQEVLRSMTVAVLGFGSQGWAHACNLRDSGINTVVGLRPGSKSKLKAEAMGLTVLSIVEAVKIADLVMIMTPDESQGALYRDAIEPNIRSGSALCFAHGFNIHYGQIKPRSDIDVILAAPKGIGDMVRELYTQGRGVAFLIAIHQDVSAQAKARALAYAAAVGGGRTGILETSFKDETETDLFGEQAVLCGGAIDLALMGYETLVEAGYEPEMAYFECIHELKLVVDLMHQKGLAAMRESISNTAEFGGYKVGSRLINEHTRNEMRAVLLDIQNGSFANEFINDADNGNPVMGSYRMAGLKHEVEPVGKRLRNLMPWINLSDSENDG